MTINASLRIAGLRAGLALILALAAGAALAQGAPSTLEAYRAATGSEDMSMSALRHALGHYLDDPLSQLGLPTTLVGRLMAIFNAFVFAAAVVWMSYNVVRHVVSTAATGQIIGSGTPLAGLWLPVRYITGIASTVPVFGGLNLAQALMIWCAGLGIGLANFMWSGAVQVASSFEELVKPPVFSPSATPSAEEAAGALFAAHVCRLAAEREAAISAENSPGSPPSLRDRFRAWRLETGAIDSVFYGTGAYPRLCGGVALVRSDAARESSSMLGFRVASVDYEAVVGVAQAAHLAQFQVLKARVADLATRYVAERDQPGRPDMPAVPLAEIRALARGYSSGAGQRIEADLSGAHQQAITASAREQMTRFGWASAGAWYSTFSEANAALADAARSVEFAIVWPQPPAGVWGATPVGDAIDQLQNSWTRAEAADASSVGEGQGDAWARFKRFLGRQLGIETPTGNWSLGQMIVMKITGGVTAGTGGGDLVNPITAAKNVGDYLMTVGQAMLIAPAESVLDRAADAMHAKSAAWSAAGPVGKLGAAGAGVAAHAFDGLSTMVRPLAIGLFIIGCVLAIYIPLIPFITWFSGLVQYACVVGEAIVAAPLWALAHMDSAGGDDGLGGPRTARGYLYLLNVLFRPALMLFGFFLASALAVGLGTVLVVLFAPAMANAQGNSVTGLASIVGFVAIFGVLLVLLIQQLFNLIHLLPDQVLGWIGDSPGVTLGRDSEDRVRGAFIAQVHGADAAARPGAAAGAAARAAGPAGSLVRAAGDKMALKKAGE